MMLADASQYDLDEQSRAKIGEEPVDFLRCKQLIRNHQIASIPPSIFFTDPHKDQAANYLRFCFCKTDDVIEAASVQFGLIAASKSQ